MASSTAGSRGSSANGSLNTKMRTCSSAWCSSIWRPPTTTPALGQPSGGEGSRPGRVGDVEQHRAFHEGDGCLDAEVRPSGNGAHHDVGAFERREVGDRHDLHGEAQPMAEFEERRSGVGSAQEHLCGDGAEFRHGRESRRRGRSASDEHSMAHPGAAGLAERAHDTPDIRVEPPTATVGEQYGVRGAGERGELVDLVDEGQHLLLERHREREPAPAVVARREEVRQPLAVHLDGGVLPVEAEHVVCGAMQRRALRMRDRRAEHRKPGHLLIHSRPRSPRSPRTTPAAGPPRPRAPRWSSRTRSRRSRGSRARRTARCHRRDGSQR